MVGTIGLVVVGVTVIAFWCAELWVGNSGRSLSNASNGRPAGMNPAVNVDVVRAVSEAFGRGDLGVLREQFFADNSSFSSISFMSYTPRTARRPRSGLIHPIRPARRNSGPSERSDQVTAAEPR